MIKENKDIRKLLIDLIISILILIIGAVSTLYSYFSNIFEYTWLSGGLTIISIQMIFESINEIIKKENK